MFECDTNDAEVFIQQMQEKRPCQDQKDVVSLANLEKASDRGGP